MTSSSSEPARAKAARDRLWPAIAAALPGALAGIQLAGLLFFLNPHLPFSARTVFQGALFFGSLAGAVSLLFILPFTWGRPERASRALPWMLTLVLALAAIAAWTHAAQYSFFLPPGINRRLLKAAIWLSLAALIGFYTALLHHTRQRPYGGRSRVIFVLLALASISVVIERREAFKPRLESTPRASTYSGSPRPQLLVVGIEGATLDAILPLAEQGRLPFFSRMLAEGAFARLTTLRPTRRAPLWTTLATGKYPFQHGIVAERVAQAPFLTGEKLYLVPLGWGYRAFELWGEVRPIDARERRVLPLWEILARLDLRSDLLSWPLSAAAPGRPPPERVTVLSERFFTRVAEADGASPHATRDAWPAEASQRARLFRVTPEEIAPEQIGRFGRRAPAAVLDAIAADLWRENLAFFLLDQSPRSDAVFLMIPGLAEISARYFGAYSAVQLEGSSDPELVEAAQLVVAYYTHLDEFLARSWEKVGDPRLMAVVSAHGTAPAAPGRRLIDFLLRRPPQEGYFESGPDGILMLMGEGIRPGARIMQAELVDLVPTLLYGLGFPVARDLDGAVLTQAFETSFLARQPLSFLPSWETFAGPEESMDEGPATEDPRDAS